MQKHKYIPFIIFLSCWHLIPNAINAQPNIQFTTNSKTGPAPLAIHFDASATTSNTTSQAFHELHYTWDFGDCTGEQWANSNKSKNTATGPIAGHLYTQPGTYIITLKVKDSLGASSTQSINITVQNLTTQFFASNTICFSQAGNFTDVPEGALEVTTADFSTVMAALGTGKRVLLQRGETWTANSGYTFNTPGPVIFGAYGTGDEPIIINNSGNDLFTLSGSTPNLSNWTFMDLDLRSNDGTVDAFSSENYHSGLTFYNLKIDGFESGIKASVSKVDFYNAPLYQQMAIIDCDITNIMGGSGGYGAFLGVENLLFMGNRIIDAENGEHNLRCEYLDKAVISHNYLERPSTSKHVIKIHSGIYGNSASVLHQRYSEKIMISDNQIIGGINDWNVTIGPQSQGGNPPATYDERVRDVIVEKNFFKAGNSNSAQLVINAQNVTVRNNLFNNTDMVSSEGNTMLIFQRSIEPVPDQIAVYNNTIVRLNGQNTRLIDATPDPDQQTPIIATNIKYINNLLYAPDAVASLIQPMGEATHVGSHNEILPLANDFEGTSFTTWEDFQLVNEGTPVDVGFGIPVFDTYRDDDRTALYDIGAFDIQNAMQAEPDYGIQPSDTIGTGSLPVVFKAAPDTTMLLSVDGTFHDLCYSWDFGDNHAGDWAYSNQSQNIESGLVAGHFYTQPGTYTATLTITDEESNSTTDVSTIVIQDPDIIYAGTNTVCISQTGDFGDVPLGARTLTSSNFSTVIANLMTGKRVLLKRGETWAINASYTLNTAGPILLGAYGMGNNPILNVASSDDAFINLSGSTPNLNQATFQHLDIRTDDASTIAFNTQGTCDRLTFYQISLDGFYKGFNFSPDILDEHNSVGGLVHNIYSNITISECTITNMSNGGSGLYIAAENLICTGNRIENVEQGNHAMRFPFLKNAFIAHNKLSNPAAFSHLIKVDAGDFNGTTSLIDGLYSENIIIANNDLQGGMNQWNLTVGPGNETSDERVRNVLIEKNFFKAGSNNVTHLIINAQDVSVRNNLFNLTGMVDQHTAIAVEQRGIEPAPDRVRIYNNTAVGIDNSDFTFIRTSSNATNIDYCNNLGYAPTASTPLMIAGTGQTLDCGTNSLVTQNPGFVGTDFDLSNSFNMSCTSAIVDAGTPLLICDDFSGLSRIGLAPDLGAFECIESDCPVSLDLSGIAISQTYQAGQFISSTADIINHSNVIYKAGDHINLNAGFYVELGSEFHALIEGCASFNLLETPTDNVSISPRTKSIEHQLLIVPNPFSHTTEIQFMLNEDTKVQLDIFDLKGQKIETVLPRQDMKAGLYRQTYMPQQQLLSGVYWCRLILDDALVVEKMVVTQR